MTQDQIKDAIVKALNKQDQKGWNSWSLHIIVDIDLQTSITTQEFYHALFLAIEQGLITPKDGKLYPASNSPLAEIMAAANEILEGMKKRDYTAEEWTYNANLSSVSCTDVSRCVSVDGDTSVLVEIDEARCNKLESWLNAELQERFPGITFDVRSE